MGRLRTRWDQAIRRGLLPGRSWKPEPAYPELEGPCGPVPHAAAGQAERIGPGPRQVSDRGAAECGACPSGGFGGVGSHRAVGVSHRARPDSLRIGTPASRSSTYPSAKVIAIPVASPGHSLRELREGGDVPDAAQNLQMTPEVLRADGEVPWVCHRAGDAVVQEDQTVWFPGASSPPGCPRA